MKNLFLALVLAAFVHTADAIPDPKIEMIIIDLGGGLANETYDDGGTGSLVVTGLDSPILSNYWTTGSIQSAIANNQLTNYDEAELISASIQFDAVDDPGTNVGIIINATGYDLGTNDVRASTIINAATVDFAAFDAAVLLDGLTLLEVDNITTTDTFTALQDFTVGDQFTITHAFDLTALTEGADLGFDISTTVSRVPVPAPLALMGLGLLGMVGMSRRA
jgi:hypothetical protein